MKANWQVTKVMGIGRNQQVCSVEVNSESVEQGVKVRVQGAKVRASISASRYGCSNNMPLLLLPSPPVTG